MILSFLCTTAVLTLACVHACCKQNSPLIAVFIIGLALGGGEFSSLVDFFPAL